MTNINSLEQNFISCVVYAAPDHHEVISFFEKLNQCLDRHFKQYEIIAVANHASESSLQQLRKWATTVKKPVTLVELSLHQPLEQCMNAGLDIAIGDYVYEFDAPSDDYPIETIWEAYQVAMNGYDIVTACPTKERFFSKIFYRIFNANSNSVYRLHSDVFRLVSRRAINRAHAINQNLPYRKATYASCGLKMAEIEVAGASEKKHGQMELAIDSLVLYTDFGYKFSFGLTLFMFILAVLELIYTLAVWTTGSPILGWTTTMLVLTVGLAGLFAILALVMKYLTLLLKLNFRKQNYVVENVEKL